MIDPSLLVSMKSDKVTLFSFWYEFLVINMTSSLQFFTLHEGFPFCTGVFDFRGSFFITCINTRWNVHHHYQNVKQSFREKRGRKRIMKVEAMREKKSVCWNTDMTFWCKPYLCRNWAEFVPKCFRNHLSFEKALHTRSHQFVLILQSRSHKPDRTSSSTA